MAIPRENYCAKAKRLLSEGRLRVRRVDPGRVEAVCIGDSAEDYDVGWSPGFWSCSCPARGRSSHMQALMLVVHPVRREPIERVH
jgi:hypothetical protein